MKCYSYNLNAYQPIDRDKEDTADDNDLADAMIKTVDNIKAWAKRGAEKLDDSISPNPTKGAATKNAMKHLIGSDNYKDKAKDVSSKFYFITHVLQSEHD